MKIIALLSLFFAGISYGLADSDADGIPDTADLCPQVVGVRGLDGCPRVTLTPKPTLALTASTEDQLICREDLIRSGSIVYAQKICQGSSCLNLRRKSGVAKCTYVYPGLVSNTGIVYGAGPIKLFR